MKHLQSHSKSSEIHEIQYILMDSVKRLVLTLQQSTIIFQQTTSTKPLLDHHFHQILTPSSVSKDGSNIISALYSEKTNVHIIFRHLPPAIQNHIPPLHSGISSEAVSVEWFKEAMQAWLDEIAKKIHDFAMQILQNVDSATKLSSIRKALIECIWAEEYPEHVQSNKSFRDVVLTYEQVNILFFCMYAY
jgi:hypothetical protein